MSEQPPLAGAELSPLARARIRCELTVEEAARRAGITADEARWLEEERLYRFPAAGAAIAATIAYAAALGAGSEIAVAGERRARERARGPRRRGWVALGVALLAAGIGVAVWQATREHAAATPAGAAVAAAGAGVVGAGGAASAAAATPTPPPAPRLLRVDIVGTPGAAATTALAAQLRRLGYGAVRVVNPAATAAQRSTAPVPAESAGDGVYYEPGGAAAGQALGRALQLAVRPLPAGSDPRRLVVVAAG